MQLINVLKDPELMTVPLDDKAINRAYALKVELLIENGRIFQVRPSLTLNEKQVKQKLTRLLDEAKRVNLNPKHSADELVALIKKITSTSKEIQGEDF